MKNDCEGKKYEICIALVKGGVESNILRVKIPEMIWETIFKDDYYNFLKVTKLKL